MHKLWLCLCSMCIVAMFVLHMYCGYACAPCVLWLCLCSMCIVPVLVLHVYCVYACAPCVLCLCLCSMCIMAMFVLHMYCGYACALYVHHSEGILASLVLTVKQKTNCRCRVVTSCRLRSSKYYQIERCIFLKRYATIHNLMTLYLQTTMSFPPTKFA